MTDVDRQALFLKLGPVAYQALRDALDYCRQRRNPYVEIAHWLHEILKQDRADLTLILRAFEVDLGQVQSDLNAALDHLPHGSSAAEGISAHVDAAVESAWLWASITFGDTQVRTAYLLVAALKSHTLRGLLLDISREFENILPDVLIKDLRRVIQGSAEASAEKSDAQQQTSAPGGAGPAGEAAQALERFTVDLTAEARAGRLDPVIGRDLELRQVIDILMRRRQNNPLLAGEAGVGKTAIAEGLALRIVSGDVPPFLQEVSLRSLDLGLLQAGAGVKGEFEQRVRQVIDGVKASPKPVVLFIDEVHTLIGAGGVAGTGDAANLLKPALARGTLRTIGATTWREYKKYIEKDPALTRRFQVVKVEEPSEAVALAMMRGIVGAMEGHHRVQVLDSALDAAVKLSHRYISDRQLPDKSVSLLDTACARVAVSQHAVPPTVEESRRRIEETRVELSLISREQAVGIEASEREARAKETLAKAQDQLETLSAAWQEAKKLVEELMALQAKLRGDGEESGDGAALDGPQRTAALARVRALESELDRVQGEQRLILTRVDETAVASVVADWTGIPVGRMVKDEVAAILNLANTLATRVLGQDHALEGIAKRVKSSRAGLEDPSKPIGVFLLVGPSGVGKTETALTLAEALYGGEQNLITINMSEFQEQHTVSTLKGAPPGYVGYGEGGVLTEAVRRRPYSVILLDEVEKAHHDVHEIFFQVFDKGMMEDGEGRLIDFKNTLIILTSNVGTDLIMSLCDDKALRPDPEGLAKALRPELLKVFPAALLGRLVVVPYMPLTSDLMGRIVRLKLDRIATRLRLTQELRFDYSPAVVDLVVSRCNEPESGGRVVDANLTGTLLPMVSQELLARLSRGERTTTITADVSNGDFHLKFG